MNDLSKFKMMIRNIVDEMLDQQGVSRHAIVSSVDPVNALVKVTYDEGDPANGVPPTVSGWLPIAQAAVGNGWGAVCLPIPGTQVFVHPDMGDIAHGVVGGMVHSTAMPPGTITPYKATAAQPLTPGEFTLIHSDGTSFRMTTGGPQIHGNLLVDGNIMASGEITDLNGIHGSLDALRQDYDQHQHGGVQTGAGFTTTTNKPTP